MSAWGISNFENDTALDWVGKIVKQKDINVITNSIDKFVNGFNAEETTLINCSKFLTIAEILAGLLGSPAEDFPEELTDWIESKYINIEQSTIDTAIEGVRLLMNESEVREMYLDSGYFNSLEWIQPKMLSVL